MSEKFSQKVIQLKQRSAMREVMTQIDGHLIVAEQIFHPESGQIARELKLKSNEREDSAPTRMTSCETRSLSELDEIYYDFIASLRDCGDLLCVLPGVSTIDDIVTTKLPVLRTDVAGAEQLYAFFSRSSDFDFYGVVSSDRKAFIVISSYADFPGDANQYFDGAVYEASFGRLST
jgi:hypothetical protein